MDTAAQQAAGIESQLAAPESGGGTVTDTSPIVLVLTVDLGNGDFSRCVTQVKLSPTWLCCARGTS